MKALSIMLVALCILTNVSAQSNSSVIETELINLLKSKHDYERLLAVRKEGAHAYKIKYKQLFEDVKENKDQVLLYINHSLKADSVVLSKAFIDYKYVSPVSSFHDVKNRISMLTYFTIVRYSLENSQELLPSLGEIKF